MVACISDHSMKRREQATVRIDREDKIMQLDITTRVMVSINWHGLSAAAYATTASCPHSMAIL